MEVLSVTNIKYSSPEEDWEYSEFPESEEASLIEALSKRLEAELRTAKRTHLSVGELADSEPCGLRGCTLYINFEADELKTKLSTIKCDPTTPSTFEVYLTLKQSTAGWNSFLPQFLKKITRGGTVMISPEYGLQKKKLYRSTSD
ncbi:hypothetical protein NQ314_001755 [Rhamnusium bicolor]|uniref:Uncharacterized protein n=1 Tax=Rhamnusium bicolor TaxID=1586634 RepID=A0AAV8ZT58_9CUCU|nr:hypothetical protein NQ314_001755 [Rhamnusium bicolor]